MDCFFCFLCDFVLYVVENTCLSVGEKMSHCDEIIVGLGERQYPIVIDWQWLGEIGARVKLALPKANRLLVVTNPRINQLHGKAALESLRAAGLNADLIEIPEGEANKTVGVTSLIWDRLISIGASRQAALIALGGGIVGDIAGFAAATYMRGIDFVQVPTTLLAMVDSSVGGKTGVNHPQAKNIIGCFWQPKLVFMDLSLLKTLPREEFRAGFAEVIKHGIIRDADYFHFLEANLDAIMRLEPEALRRVVRISCEIKAGVVAQDEREMGVRAILNFGHTLGHAIEALGHYEGSRHGEAVSVGMVGAARIACEMGLLKIADMERIERLIEQSGLPVRFPAFESAAIIERLKSDKKVRDGRVRFVLPTEIGNVVIRDDIPSELIAKVIQEMGALR